jgi:membrane protease subunit HflC
MRGFVLLLLILVAVLVGSIWLGQYGVGPVVITNEDEFNLILTLGNPTRDPITEPGLTLRTPFLDTVVTLDKRLQYLNAEPAALLIGNETMLVDYYAIWHITDPLAFRRSYPRERDAEVALQARLKSLVGATIGRLPLQLVLSRGAVLDDLDSELSAALEGKGIEVVDLRINRTELPKDTEASAFARMREERRAISREHRAKGEREARELRAKAEREARTLQAEARSRAEVARGQGDAEAAAIYADAYGRDAEFYSFVRSLQAYRATLGERTTMVLPPDHDFFRYLDSGSEESARSTPKPAPAPPVSAAGD